MTPTTSTRTAPPALDHQRCDAALARAFGFLGKRWNGILLATLQDGPVGFTALRRSVAGITDSVLSDRLSELAAAGLVVRTVVDSRPPGVSYALSPAGQALLPVLDQLAAWARDNLPVEQCREGLRDCRPVADP